jgi:hypothetical protein
MRMEETCRTNAQSKKRGAIGVRASRRQPRPVRLAPEAHAMPPGSFRLTVINGFDFGTALSARARLENHFLVRQPVPLALQG